MHSSFDRSVLDHSCDLHGVDRFVCNWVDSVRIARSAWPHLADQGGYRLANLARGLGITFQHHDALEDARAAGHVVVRALADMGMALDDWHRQAEAARTANRNDERKALHRTGDGDGPLLGERVAFTGNFTARKTELADMAHIAGAAVEPGVNKRTTMLVVGTQDWAVVGPTGKSTKQRRAEELIAAEQPILVITEDDFRVLVRGPGGLPL